MTSLRPPCGITFTGPVMPLCLSTTLASQPLSCPAAGVSRPPCQGPRAGAVAGGGQIRRPRGGPRARLGPRRAEARGPRLAGSSGAPHPVPLANFPFRFPAAPARPESEPRASTLPERSPPGAPLGTGERARRLSRLGPAWPEAGAGGVPQFAFVARGVGGPGADA